MRTDVLGPYSVVRSIVCTAAVGIAVGCASPAFVAPAPTPSDVERASAVDRIDVAPIVEPPTVAVREYTRSPTVAVVGWAAEETAYGCARCCDVMAHQISRTACT